MQAVYSLSNSSSISSMISELKDLFNKSRSSSKTVSFNIKS